MLIFICMYMCVYMYIHAYIYITLHYEVLGIYVRFVYGLEGALTNSFLGVVKHLDMQLSQSFIVTC